jgi:hypothetical protein
MLALGDDLGEGGGKADCGGVGEAEEGGVIELLELLDNGSEDVGMGVAVDIGPDGAVAVEVGGSIGGSEGALASGLDDGKGVVGMKPGIIWREGVPEESAIEGDEGLSGIGLRHGVEFSVARGLGNVFEGMVSIDVDFVIDVTIWSLAERILKG